MIDSHIYFQQFLHHFVKIGKISKTIFANPAGIASMVPVIASAELTTIQKALWLLAGLFIADFITGIIASWVEFKKSLPVLPGSGKRYVIQSSKLRMSALKFIAYGMMLIVARGIEWAFIVPGQEFEPHASLNKMTLTTIAAGFLCVIEVYSIVFENLKRMGFDVIQRVKTISVKGWDLYKSVKNEKSE